MTLDQMFESFRKASESSMQMQQEMVNQWTHQWGSVPLNAAGVSAEWMQKLQKRWIEFSTESLNTHRQSLDSMYRSAIQVLEQAFRLSESKTPDDYRRTIEELRQKLFETFKNQSESQLHEIQKSAEKWFDVLKA